MKFVTGAVVAALVGLTALVTVSHGAAVTPQPELRTVKACFQTGERAVPVVLEVASSRQERQKGLMGRDALARDTGMLFQYRHAQGPDRGFWMHNTRLPLDIAYLNAEGRIGSIVPMAPCTSSRGADCPTYPAGVSFISAVEMNQGFFDRYGIEVGDRLVTGSEHCPGR